MHLTTPTCLTRSPLVEIRHTSARVTVNARTRERVDVIVACGTIPTGTACTFIDI